MVILGEISSFVNPSSLYMLGNFWSADFQKLFQEYNAIRVSNSLDPVQARHFVNLN